MEVMLQLDLIAAFNPHRQPYSNWDKDERLASCSYLTMWRINEI